MNKRIKKIIIAFVTIVLIVGIINLVWVLVCFLPYNNYAKKMKKMGEEDGGLLVSHELYTEDYHITLSMPGYLQFKNPGYISITYAEPVTLEYDSDGYVANSSRDLDIIIYIWLDKIWGDNYGVMIWDYSNGCCYQVYFDSDIKYVSNDEVDIETNNVAQTLLDDNRDEIEKMLQSLDETIGLKIK